MNYETFLKEKLPMLLQSLAIAVVINLVLKKNNIFHLTLAIFGSSVILELYAPKIAEARGIGMRMIGGDPEKDSCVCNNAYSLGLDKRDEAMKKEETMKKEEAMKRGAEVSACDALFSAGFDINWTSEAVDQMLKTPAGKEALYEIDRKLRASIGRSMTRGDIQKCLPGYVDEFICRRI